jgi:hypothetical protein
VLIDSPWQTNVLARFSSPGMNRRAVWPIANPFVNDDWPHSGHRSSDFCFSMLSSYPSGGVGENHLKEPPAAWAFAPRRARGRSFRERRARRPQTDELGFSRPPKTAILYRMNGASVHSPSPAFHDQPSSEAKSDLGDRPAGRRLGGIFDLVAWLLGY